MSQIPNNTKITEIPIEHMMSIMGKGLMPSPNPTTTAKGWKMRIDATSPSIFIRVILWKKPITSGITSTPVTRMSAIFKSSVISVCQEKEFIQQVSDRPE
ncbi:MAG TPA: hypothetical protein VMW77_02825 [Methanoregula sp.]|nr:hypothetical protein [Methanoregula sp.]